MDISSNKIIIFIDNYKFDVTEYANTYPGGKKFYKNIIIKMQPKLSTK